MWLYSPLAQHSQVHRLPSNKTSSLYNPSRDGTLDYISFRKEKKILHNLFQQPDILKINILAYFAAPMNVFNHTLCIIHQC